jgi:hypothetical protein
MSNIAESVREAELLNQNVEKMKIDHLKNLLTFLFFREKRVKEYVNLKAWLDNENVKRHHLAEEYKANNHYQDPEIKKIALEQITLSGNMYNIVEDKYRELLRFIQNGDCLVKSHINVGEHSAYPSAIEIQQINNASLVLDIVSSS